jgi:hypothetical protein
MLLPFTANLKEESASSSKPHFRRLILRKRIKDKSVTVFYRGFLVSVESK